MRASQHPSDTIQSAATRAGPAAGAPHPSAQALLVLAIAHTRGALTARAVVTNGGGQPVERARLALCALDHIGVRDIPVGAGSEGSPYTPQPHEYALAGQSEVDPSRMLDGGALLRSALDGAAARSLTFVCISSLRDLADLINADARLFVAKTRMVSIQAGLERRAGAPFGWAPDSSVNNGFDLPAAQRVFAFCMERAVPMTVTSRAAVPLLPMQLARR